MQLCPFYIIISNISHGFHFQQLILHFLSFLVAKNEEIVMCGYYNILRQLPRLNRTIVYIFLSTYFIFRKRYWYRTIIIQLYPRIRKLSSFYVH